MIFSSSEFVSASTVLCPDGFILDHNQDFEFESSFRSAYHKPLAPPSKTCHARKVRRVVDTARALVLCDLRIRAKRPRAIHLPGGCMRRNHLLQRNALFDPRFHRAHLVEFIRSFAAPAMAHA